MEEDYIGYKRDIKITQEAAPLKTTGIARGCGMDEEQHGNALTPDASFPIWFLRISRSCSDPA